MKDARFSCMKGLAITGVVAGHLGFETLEMFVNYWHLPVFYFVSGYFFKDGTLKNGRKFFLSRFKRLILPFLLLCSVAILGHNLFSSLGIISAGRFGVYDLINEFKRLIFTFSTNEQLVGAIWFLPSLFFVSTFVWLSAKLISKFNSTRYAIGGLLCCFMGVTGVLLKLPSPFCLWQNMSLTGIFIFGYTVSRYELCRYVSSPVAVIISIIVLTICLLKEVRVGCQADAINRITLWYPIIFVAGIVTVFSLSSIIKDSVVGRFIAVIGDYSFSIMAFHFVGFKLVTACHSYYNEEVMLNSFPTSDIDLNLWWILYLMVGIVFPVVLAKAYSGIRHRINRQILFVK